MHLYAVANFSNYYRLQAIYRLAHTEHLERETKLARAPVRNPGGVVLPYMGYVGMCGPKGYGFSAVLVIDWVSIFALWSSTQFF